jgi:membrane associated rhomboid family serine protease
MRPRERFYRGSMAADLVAFGDGGRALELKFRAFLDDLSEIHGHRRLRGNILECFSPIGRREDFRQHDQWARPQGWRERASRWLPHTLPSASAIILGLCVLVFLLSLVAPGFVYGFLALNPRLLEERPWTLLTHMFVHASFDHLFWNMLFLFFFGTELERRIGERRFLAVYLISGIAAALAQIFVFPGVLVGASGALYGVLGCLALIAPEIRVLIFFAIPLSIRWAVVLFALIDFLMMGSADSIAHMAHISGLFIGLAYGYILRRRPRFYF